VSHLLGEGVEARHLNDDRLGRVLDQLYEAGITPLFMKVALQAVQRFGINIEQRHLDSTSISVEGEYARATVTKPEGSAEAENEEDSREEPVPIEICRGYSRDYRPDLKQFLLTLVCSADGGVPLWLKVASGNRHDSEVFAQVLEDFSEQWTQEGIVVMDAAFYTQPNLQQVGSLGWLSRVPLTLKAAQALVQEEVSLLSEVPCDSPDYRMWEVEQTYGGVAQRWVLIETLMIYTLAERKLRQALEDQNQTVRDQRKQPTAKPTFRWIMQKFQGIHWINLEGQRQISNLSDERQLIIRLLGPPVERYYQSSG
jgi:transposase